MRVGRLTVEWDWMGGPGNWEYAWWRPGDGGRWWLEAGPLFVRWGFAR